MSILISIAKLLSGKYVEGTRMEFKKGWNPIPVRTRRYRNRQIGSFLKELGLTEEKGTGIPIIYQALKDNGSPKPIFDTNYPNRSYFVVEFPIYLNFTDIGEGGSIGGSMGGSIGGAINLTDRQNEIISIIKSDNKISYRAIAEKLKINDSAVKKHLNTLKKKGVLQRIGGTRGHCEVKE